MSSYVFFMGHMLEEVICHSSNLKSTHSRLFTILVRTACISLCSNSMKVKIRGNTSWIPMVTLKSKQILHLLFT